MLDCCKYILVEASPDAQISKNNYYKLFLGLWVKSTEETEDVRTKEKFPIYTLVENQFRYLARSRNVTTNFSWVMNQDWGYYSPKPGTSSGAMYYGPADAKCPDQLTTAAYTDPYDYSKIVDEKNKVTFTCKSTGKSDIYVFCIRQLSPIILLILQQQQQLFKAFPVSPLVLVSVSGGIAQRQSDQQWQQWEVKQQQTFRL